MGVDLSSSSIPQMGVVPGQPQSGKAKELAKSLTHGVELQDKKKKKTKKKKAACTSVCEKFSLFYSYFRRLHFILLRRS